MPVRRVNASEKRQRNALLRSETRSSVMRRQRRKLRVRKHVLQVQRKREMREPDVRLRQQSSKLLPKRKKKRRWRW